MSESTSATRRLDVPFLDMRSMHDPLKAGILEELATVIDTNTFVN